jgi:hypothetical protein
VTLAFPTRAEDFSGFAMVDVVNTVTVGSSDWPGGGRAFPVARLHMGEDYLFGMGTFYISALWDKAAAETLHSGSIAAPADGYEILRDAASVARDPTIAAIDTRTAPARGADRVIAYGFSQTGALLRCWHHLKQNTTEGRPSFDGTIVGGAGGGCRNLATGQDESVQGAVADGGKVIAFNLQGDVEWGGSIERGDSSDYRLYEIAGVAHIPVDLADFRGVGHPRQNPASFAPVLRATMANLQRWLEGAEPPSGTIIELSESAKTLQGWPLRPAAEDTDGNARGGLRLPHMPGLAAGDGAPLGTYAGLDLGDQTNTFFLISGTFDPFPAEELAKRYPTADAYVSAVKKAAARLVSERLILEEDADAYIKAAEQVRFDRN